MTGPLWRVVVLLIVVGLGLALGLWRRRRDGRSRTVRAGATVSAEDLGTPLGDQATLLQFSAPICSPCRATRRVLAAVAGQHPGVVHVELDVDRYLDLVRRLDVLRTPTLLVLDPAGRVVTRTTGVPTRDQVLLSLTTVLPQPARQISHPIAG
jgi:thiol-disulfide isomerase/thioredoxin